MAQRLELERPVSGARPRSTVLWILGAAVAAVVLRAPLIGGLAFPDEGGALIVARSWTGDGPGLYGFFFLDRPPLTVLFWRLSDGLGGVEAGRWLATAGVVLLVVSASWAGHLLGGDRGARWAAVVSAALASTPLLGTQEANGELLGAPLVMLSCALTLAAMRPVRTPPARVALAFAAGVVAAGALLVKQNLAGAMVFAFVLAVAGAVGRRWSVGTAASVVVPGAVGVAVPLLATVAWADRGPGLATLWYTLYGFRVDAADVIATEDLSAPDLRLGMLVVLALASGVGPLLGLFVWRARRGVAAGHPVTVAVLALVVTELAVILLGGSYWPHYLVGLVPVAALAAGAMARLPGPRRWPRAWVVLVAGSAVVAALVAAVVVSIPDVRYSRSAEGALVDWLAEARQPDDTGLVAYGHPNIVEASGLRPAGYPYLWSLPLRVEDPDATDLTALLASRSRPTWLVEWIGLDSWDLDRSGRLADAVSTHYRDVGPVCGTPVYLRVDEHRTLPDPPGSC